MSAIRHYAILGLVGEGGQGKVYRARLKEGTFEKDVALKILHAGVDSEVLDELREEARIQALIRDRAVVNVEPPFLLDGAWAMVMEFVDGVTLSEVCRQFGTLPPTVALEIVAEVARVLEKAWTTPGPDGRPLHLQHCDIKPGNLQLTPSGEVRLLDFGAAQRAFDENSASTIAGTPGYLAPERVEGQLEATSDVFSLGVTLWKVLTGTRGRFQSERDIQDAIDQVGGQDLDLRNTLQLAVQMRDPYPARRPTPGEVRAAALGLMRTMKGPDLSEWCQRIEQRHLVEDSMTGVKLAYTGATLQPPPTRQARSSGPHKGTVLGVGLGLLATVAIVGGVVVGVGGIGFARWMDGASEPVVRGAPPGSQLLILESDPAGAEVFMDGRSIGTTPLLDVVVRDGSYQMRMKKGMFSIERPIEVGPDAPHRYGWEITRGDAGLRWK